MNPKYYFLYYNNKKAFETKEALKASGKKLQQDYPELIAFLQGLFAK